MDNHECTQPVFDSQLDSPVSDGSVDGCNTLPWGRLIPSYAASSGVGTHDFYPRNSAIRDTDSKSVIPETDTYTIGRNRKCDVIINDSRVSGCHCRIYRALEDRLGSSSRLTVYLEDTSSNGTFLNKTKLKRRERRPLLTGDELTFLSPKISEARRTAYMYVSLVDRNTDLLVPPLLAPQSESGERSLTLAKSSTDRNLEKDYELREELGSGSIGKVYRAIERRTDEAYAVKIIPTRQFAFERSFSVGDLLQEARMLRNFSPPAIVSIRDAYNEEAFLAIVMQLVEGGDLFDRILKRKKYPELDARDVMNYLLSALAYLHARGIAHRDIKPENILLRTENSDVDVLLTDFGLAKGKAVGPHGCKTFCGTPQYLAPEVMECQNGDSVTVGGYDGAAADMWSVGIVLFVLLSGTQPANSKVENKWTTCSFNESAWETVSEEAKDLIRRLTAVDANERPSAAAALLMPWFIDQSNRNTNIRLPGVGPSNPFKRQKIDG
mmetsp:Transcript_23801/g.71400  ORF Transcript_23801/g.71400 Transcript_23801/m.71400 type:complete len:495 (+) Transcript_23801:178-1662(+)